jgi:serine/threonine protein kinase
MNNLKIISCIGSGSFSSIYKVKKNQSIYAMKVTALTDDNLRNVMTEIHILAKGRSKYILTMRDVEINIKEGILYTYLDYFKRGNLQMEINNRLENKEYFPEETIRKFFTQILLGTKYLHDNNIIHRDIKPSNILITHLYNLKLCDFNTSKVLTPTDFNRKMSHTQIGTPYYMSPEVIDNYHYDDRIDIWSIGCVLYELLELQIAFRTNHIGKLFLDIRRCHYKKMKNKGRYSKELLWFIDYLLKIEERPTVNDILNTEYFYESTESFSNDIPENIPYPKNIYEFEKIIQLNYKHQNDTGLSNVIHVKKIELKPRVIT